MGRHPCCPPSPEHRDDPSALFDEVQKSDMAMLRCVDGPVVLELEGQLLRWR
jgi:hypothetical protein